MEDAKNVQTEAKTQDGISASLHSLISYVKSKKSKTTRKNKGSTFVTVLFFNVLWWFSHSRRFRSHLKYF